MTQKMNRLWDGVVLHVPPALLVAYRRVLAGRGWVTVPRGGAVGGATPEDAKEHFCSVFQSSACRQVAFLHDPLSVCDPIAEELKSVLRGGRLHILDLASGAGPASLGLLATLAELRSSGQLASLPLNVVIEAADYNRDCLELFQEMAALVEPELRRAGIDLSCRQVEWDATRPLATRSLIDRLLADYESHDLLVLVSLISAAAGSEQSYDRFRESFEQIKLRIVDRGTLLWTEPGDANKRGRWLMNRVEAFFDKIGLSDSGSRRDRIDVKYNWFEPFGGTSHTSLIAALIVRRVNK